MLSVESGRVLSLLLLEEMDKSRGSEEIRSLLFSSWVEVWVVVLLFKIPPEISGDMLISLDLGD